MPLRFSYPGRQTVASAPRPGKKARPSGQGKAATHSAHRYTEKFKRDAIALVDPSGKTVTAVARELGISSESLLGWYCRPKTDQGEGGSGELTSTEREELKRLHKNGSRTLSSPKAM
ncbi:transposase [Streptomyces clavifer]|uniref:transposase n=1 Tax=Streptomyces clavifer TaxID=68188 RepID=UPI003816FC34